MGRKTLSIKKGTGGGAPQGLSSVLGVSSDAGGASITNLSSLQIGTTTYYDFKVSLSAAEVRSLAGTPIELVPNPGVGFMVRPTDAIAVLTFGTVAFTSLQLYIYSGSVINAINNAQMSTDQFLDTPNDIKMTFSNSGLWNGAESNIVENQALFITANGDSAVGDSTVDIYLSYKIITL